MTKSASKFKKNMLPIILTVIVIIGFLFSALYLMNRVNPLFADAKKECDECPYIERDSNHNRNPFEYLFGPQGIFYNPSPTPPTQYRPWWNPVNIPAPTKPPLPVQVIPPHTPRR